MVEVRQTARYRAWFAGLRDERARARVNLRIRRVELGNFGDVKFFEGIGELRVNYGPGYRIYFARRHGEVVILLAGGDKKSQRRDIRDALEMAKEL